MNLLPGKQLRTRHIPADVNDLVAHFIRLAGVFPAGRDDQAGHARADAPGAALGRQQAWFGVAVGPVAAPQQEAGIQGCALDPGEGDGLVGETPRADHGQRVRQMEMNGPQEGDAVLGGNGRYGQGADVAGRHQRVGWATSSATAEMPGRVSVQYIEPGRR